MDTRALWFSEGVTSTVGDLMLVRAGLIDEQQYLAAGRRRDHRVATASGAHLAVGGELEPGRMVRGQRRSIARRSAASATTTRAKSSGILLDLRIRQLTNGTKSLRDLFHWMNDHYAKQHRYFPDSAGVEQAAETITGQSFAEFFRDYVAGRERNSVRRVLPVRRTAGCAEDRLEWRPLDSRTTANLGGQPEVARVDPNSDAQRQGIRWAIAWPR